MCRRVQPRIAAVNANVISNWNTEITNRCVILFPCCRSSPKGRISAAANSGCNRLGIETRKRTTEQFFLYGSVSGTRGDDQSPDSLWSRENAPSWLRQISDLR